MLTLMYACVCSKNKYEYFLLNCFQFVLPFSTNNLSCQLILNDSSQFLFFGKPHLCQPDDVTLADKFK